MVPRQIHELVPKLHEHDVDQIEFLSWLELAQKVDANGIKTPKYRRQLMKAKLSAWWTKGDLPIPTTKEIQSGQHHAHEALEQAHEFGVEPHKEEIVTSTNH